MQTPERVRAMHARYSEGASLGDVGAEFGISAVRVSQLFKAAGLPTRKGPGPGFRARNDAARLERARAMHEAYETGLTYAQVAERFGVTKVRVSQLFAWAGLPSRRARGLEP